MNEERQQLLDYLSEIARRSAAGQIPWEQPNPSTFQWQKRSTDNIHSVVIQKATNPRIRFQDLADNVPQYTYLFQVKSHRAGGNVMSLSSKERPEFTKILEQIFRGAEAGIDRRSTEVLKSLLD